MQRSLLALLRGSDGRSLARALALLLFVNALLAGLHGGMLAEAATGRTLITCSIAGAGHVPVGPIQDNERACCVLGCASSLSPTTLTEPPATPGPAPQAVVAAVLPAPDMTVAPFRIEAPTGPRGPPLLV